MTSRGRAGRAAIAVVAALIAAWILASPGPAGAQSTSVGPSSQDEQDDAEPPHPSAVAMPPTAAAPAFPPPLAPVAPAPGVPPAPPSPPAVQTDVEVPHRAVTEDPWPRAAIHRPLTLPQGMSSLDALVEAVRPSPDYLVAGPTGPLPFSSYATLGVGAAFGVTNRLELDLLWPRLFCVSDGTASGCDATNRHNGAGASASYALHRGSTFHLAARGGATIVLSSPLVLQWSGGVSMKVVAGEQLAIFSSVSVRRMIDPPAWAGPSLLIATWTTRLDLQLTDEWLLYAGAYPWGPLADLGQGVELGIFGGIAYTYSPNAEVTVAAADGFLLMPPPAWNHFVPESTTTLSLVYWNR